MLGVYLQILEFVLTFHARLESVGLIYTVYPGYSCGTYIKTLNGWEISNFKHQEKIGYLYQGVYVAMGSKVFILFKRNGNYKMEKPRILKHHPLSSCLQNKNKVYSCYMIFNVLIDIFEVIFMNCTINIDVISYKLYNYYMYIARQMLDSIYTLLNKVGAMEVGDKRWPCVVL